jgi:hypothetical protein
MVQPSARAEEPASTVQIGKPSFDLGTVRPASIASLSFSISLIDMRECLTVYCQNVGDALRDLRPIAVNVNAALGPQSDAAHAVSGVI